MVKNMARFRNRLVHIYLEVDRVMVYNIIQTRLTDYIDFKRYILAFLTKNVE